MKRKVIQLAQSTLVVTLPNSWVKEWGVEKGEVLELVESGPRLFISTEKPKKMPKSTVDLSSAPDRVVRWVLSSLNKKGYDEIEVITESEKQAELIDELMRDLFLGFAVVERAEQRCVIKSLSKEFDKEFEVILRRAFLVTLELAEGLGKAIKEKDRKRIGSLLKLEKTNNQLTNFCERVLNKRGHEDPVKNTFMYVIVWNLEKIADEYKYIGEHLAEDQAVAKSTTVLFERVNELMREYYNLFYTFDMKKLAVLAEKFKEAKQEITEKLPGSKDAVILSHLLGIVLRAADFSASTVAINN